MGEGLLYTSLALVIALALVEFLLPLAAANTGKPLTFDYAQNVRLIVALVAGAVAVGLLAGLYPAVALSSFRPASVLKGGLARTPGSARLRQILIGLQFTPLLILAAWSTTLYLQANTSYQNSLRMAPPDALMVREPCTPGLKAAFAAIPGVARVGCVEMGGTFGMGGKGRAPIVGVPLNAAEVIAKGEELDLWHSLTDREGMDYHSLQPLAGRLWAGPEDRRGVILNEDAVRKLGFASPAAAVGQTLQARKRTTDPVLAYPIIGVVPNRGGVEDFQASVYYPIGPEERDNPYFGINLAKDADVSAVLAAVDRAFAETGARQAPRRQLYRDNLSNSFAGQWRELQFLLACVVIGVTIAAFGLFGLAAFLAEQRTKEIGVRKALGASRQRLLQMLVFQFSSPVLVANLVAIPLVVALFAFLERERSPEMRTDLPPTVFIAIVAASLLVAFVATFSHAWQVTGARPVKALRYE
jgi:putative ABC transport system permease protein